MDEKIIALMSESQQEMARKTKQKAFEEKVFKSIREGSLEIDDEIIEFEEKSLLDGKIKIFLPKAFEIMLPEAAAVKYPSERRPGLIFSNESTTISIAFNHTENALEEKDMEKFKESMMQIMKRMQPAAQWFEDGVREQEGRKTGYFDFLVPALDSNIYSFMLFASLDGKALICSFNCTEEEMEDWKPIAKGMMQSFRICDKG